MTHLVTEASTVHAISKHPTVDNHYLTSLTQIISSSSSLSKETSRNVIKRIPRLKRISQCEWTLYTVADPGEGPGRPAPPPPCFYTKLRPEGPKKSFFATAPLLPLIWRSGCVTGINTWHYHYPCSPFLLFLLLVLSSYFLRLPSLRVLSFSSDSPSIVSCFFFVHFTLNIIQYDLRTVEACVAEQPTPRTLVGGSSLARCVVSLDKEVYSTLSLFTQV